jgi:DNA-3-methyladenine glycosylase II
MNTGVPAQTSIDVPFVKPYDFALSMLARRSFRPLPDSPDKAMRLAVKIEGKPVLIEITGSPDKSVLRAASQPESDSNRVRSLVQWALFTELELSPFYRLANKNPKTSPIIKKFYGLKPTRPASLFEMAVTAITEQQISLASAYSIRNRLVERFGEKISDLWIFPEPASLANAADEELRACGLSKQKADYIRTLANRISAGELDIDSLKQMNDEQARETIMAWRGFGRWSADYMLIRGLARPDCVPVDDIGIREVIGIYLGEGRRVTPEEAIETLERFRPYRGLMAFYLLVNKRLNFT